MVFPRALNRLICRVLVGVFLFAQLAVAAYACPGTSSGADASALHSESSAMSMPGCKDMDMDQKSTNLCAEHCKFGQQSSDTASVPSLAAPAPALLYLLPAQQDESALAAAIASTAGPLHVAASPPHAILHCVLRI